MTIQLADFLARYRLDGQSPRISPTAGRAEFCQLLAFLGFTKGAEIGVWAGEFSEQLFNAVPGLHLTCVDPWQAYATYKEKKNHAGRLQAAYEATCVRLQPYDCQILRMTSERAAEQIPDRSLDFVYIDGNHAEAFVMADLRLWVPKVRSGGIIAGHDYEPVQAHPWIEVKAAVDAFTADRDIHPWYVLAADRAPTYFWVQP